jgi:succinate dehydrogenase / fumarate reductase, membrane anchor subunit
MGNGTRIGRVRGLGSAHHGAHHWLMQRFTAVGNLVGVGFLVISFALMPSYSYAAMSGWAGQPLVALVLAVMVVSVFWHARMGLQVVIEDYVPSAASRFGWFAALNIAVFAGAGFALICIARLALAAPVVTAAAGGAA